ncbi:hypothetical protein B0H11DRAFT_2240369 [Mycena galericulata]|nr:hypothetical protein B0H11DRAFT_2240369 [Mycena galericulata]
MSSRPPSLIPTNLPLEDLVMDDRGLKDPRYYCLPPFRGDRTRKAVVRVGGGYPLHLVGQGHIVGVFNDWVEAKASLSGYPNNSNQGCHTEEECIEVWQRLCVLGVHPHPVDPAFLTPPSNAAAAFLDTKQSPVKRETTPGNTQLLADLERSEIRYRELQRLGEEPDMLVTTSVRQATLFALEEEDVGGDGA